MTDRAERAVLWVMGMRFNLRTAVIMFIAIWTAVAIFEVLGYVFSGECKKAVIWIGVLACQAFVLGGLMG